MSLPQKQKRIAPDDQHEQRRDRNIDARLDVHRAEFAGRDTTIECCTQQRAAADDDMVVVVLRHIGKIARLGDDEFHDATKMGVADLLPPAIQERLQEAGRRPLIFRQLLLGGGQRRHDAFFDDRLNRASLLSK